MSENVLRSLPPVHELADSPRLKELAQRSGRGVVVDGIRRALEQLREEVLKANGNASSMDLTPEGIIARVEQDIKRSEVSPLRPVINATGILLHTGLGRAPLAEEAVKEMMSVAADYASVELDLNSGRRSQRVVAVEGLLRELTGAEAAVVVNNCAGATLLTLAALAVGREVIVSRGELIEIGGSFRLPDVMSASGAILREVGTTNKTHLRDYADAINERTAALLLVHPSNYVVQGFTAKVELEELVRLGREAKLPVIHDIGSGAMIDFAEFGFSDEPIAGESLRQGADVVLFSGDKLLGGPQAGIILGKKEYVEKIARHPLARALRVDKMTLAALRGTLLLYRDPDIARDSIPLLRFLRADLEDLRLRAQNLADQLTSLPGIKEVEVLEEQTYLGGGSIPTQQLPTWCISLRIEGKSLEELAQALRAGTPSVVGRVQNGRFLLDLRGVFSRQDLEILRAIKCLTNTSPGC